MLPQYSQKAFWIYKFSSEHVSVWCQKKHLHCTISWLPRTTFLKNFKSKYLSISVYLVRKFLFQRRKILPGGKWVGARLNNFFKAAHCFGLVKCIRFFISIEIFGNSTLFQHFDTSIYSIKTLRFSRQFGRQG